MLRKANLDNLAEGRTKWIRNGKKTEEGKEREKGKEGETKG